jgi:hypothetical protein
MDYHNGRWKLIEGGQPFDGPCRVAFTDDGLLVWPQGQDERYLYFSDLDRVVAEDYQVLLDIYNPPDPPMRAALYFLGAYYGQFVADLGDKRRRQLTTNLLLEDDGFWKDYACAYRLETPAGLASQDAGARVSLYRNSLVVFPALADPFNFSYSSLQSWTFDEAAYAMNLSFDLGEKLTLTMMGTRFREFERDIGAQVDAMHERVAALLAPALPEGTSESTVLRLARVMKRGKATSRAAIDGVAPGLWNSLVAAAFAPLEDDAAATRGPEGSPEATPQASESSAARRVVFDYLAGRAKPEDTYLGVRESSSSRGGELDGGLPTSREDGGAISKPLFWFVVALPRSNAMASEIMSETGHATYFFRIRESGKPTPAETAAKVRVLNRALQALNFKREAILATDADLAKDKMLRYRVAVRKLPYLRDVRRWFLGRAIHTNEAAWRKQAENLLRP